MIGRVNNNMEGNSGINLKIALLSYMVVGKTPKNWSITVIKKAVTMFGSL